MPLHFRFLVSRVDLGFAIFHARVFRVRSDFCSRFANRFVMLSIHAHVFENL